MTSNTGNLYVVFFLISSLYNMFTQDVKQIGDVTEMKKITILLEDVKLFEKSKD